MPFAPDPSLRGRIGVFVRTQLPFAVGVLVILVVAAIAMPGALPTPLFLGGIAVATAATLAAVALPWEQWAVAWQVTVAVADLVAVAMLRTELFPAISGVGLLAIFPVLWLAYGFHGAVISVAVAGTLLVTSFPYLLTGQWPVTPLAWVNLLLFPILMVGISMVVSIGAAQLRRHRRRLMRVNSELTDALQFSRDGEIVVRTMLNTVESGVALYDASERLVMANDTAERLAELAGLRLDAPPRAGERVLAADRMTPVALEEQLIPRALAGETISGRIAWIGPPDRQVAISSNARRAFGQDGGVLGTVIASHDVTELAAAIEVREEFLRTVSHELRTPVTNMLGYFEMLTEHIDTDDTTTATYVEVIERNTRRLQDRIEELLAAADISEPLQIRRIDIASLVRASLRGLRDKADARGITLEHLGAEPTPADADQWRLWLAINELVNNAIKFAHPHSAVTVGHRVEDGVLVIEVTNDGPGISRSEQTRLFDRFYRTGFARQQAVQGFGIGLTLVKNAVDAHDGRVVVDSTPGERTRFAIEIPAPAAG